MTKKEAMLYIAAILETLAEGNGSAPSGVLYLAFQTVVTLDDYQYLVSTMRDAGLITLSNHVLTLDDYQYLVSTMRDAGLITLSNHVLTLTPEGRETIKNLAKAKGAASGKQA